MEELRSTATISPSTKTEKLLETVEGLIKQFECRCPRGDGRGRVQF